MIKQHNPNSIAHYNVMIKNGERQILNLHILDAVFPQLNINKVLRDPNNYIADHDLTDALIDSLTGVYRHDLPTNVASYLKTPSVQRLYKNADRHLHDAITLRKSEDGSLYGTIDIQYNDYTHTFESDLTTFLYRLFADDLTMAGMV